LSSPVDRITAALADRYTVEPEVGQGGMATVYLAADIKHDRKVALKVLRPELAAVLGADRFVQEIKTTANLQHPHILPLFDSGEADSFLYYVMPYIEGETLRDRINRETQLGIDEAVKITTEVADALDYAHRNNVIHRDIKPENILLHDGRPMVADFGIALAVSAAAGGRMTETGLSLGTPHYMSPEQATAEKQITARSDVYSLGCVLYEMLAGEPPHSGGTAQQVIMKIITDRARSVTDLRKSVPRNVAGALGKALEKLPADRFDGAKAFAEALTNPAYTATSAAAGGAAPIAAQPVVSWRRWAWPAAAAVLALLAAWGWFRPGPRPAVARYGLAFPAGQDLLDINNRTFGLAPDGSWIVYDGPAETDNQLWIKRRDAYEATPVSGTSNNGGSAPAVSPDGEWIVFTTEGQLRKVARGGGSTITVADSVDMTTRGVAWLEDGTIVYRDDANLLRRVPDTGGNAEVIWVPPQGEDIRPRLPVPLPDARGVLFGYCGGNTCRPRSVWVVDLESGDAHEVVPDAMQAWYASTGYLVFVRGDGGVFAAPFDLGSLSVSGPPVPVLEGVQMGIGLYPDMALSPSGVLLMIGGSAVGAAGIPAEIVWVTRGGQVAQVDPEWQFLVPGNFGAALSPDGGRLALAIMGEGDSDIWIKELDRGPLDRLTLDDANDRRPRWTPDGDMISFMSQRGPNQDVWIRRADQTRPAELTLDLDEVISEALWSRDGTWLVVRTGDEGNRDIWAQRIGTDSVPSRLLASDFDENAVSLSPDGRWLAYQSDETGDTEIYVRPFPDIASGKRTISVGGGLWPLWSHSGSELFYVDGEDRMTAAQLRFTDDVEVTERRVLFPASQFIFSGPYTAFDISPDDQRFIMARPVDASEAARAELILVENWFEELKAKVGS
jgi:Tol biopolymer transport system component/tRNA A-37 threonylcarbamoyl transferase component Bud32